MKKSTRASIAKDTLKILKQGYYTNPQGKQVSIKKAQSSAEQKTKVFRSEELEELISQPIANNSQFETVFEVINSTTLDCVRALHKEGASEILCLNFASARNPGGGFLKGSEAQEESIARASGLYNCQLKAKPYYDKNRAFESCLYSDYMIYSPKVPLFRTEKGELMEDYVPVSIITAPAPNAGVIKRQERKNIQHIKPTLVRRIDMVLTISKLYQHDTLVLGAWGCGVFDNDPVQVAELFEEALKTKYKGQFKNVTFAIYSKEERFINPFQERFIG